MCMPPACSRVVWLDKRLKDSRLEVEMKRWHALARDGSPLPTMKQVTSSPLAAVLPLAEIPAVSWLRMADATQKGTDWGQSLSGD